MFKLRNISIVALVLFVFFACKKQNLQTYNITNNIYFADSLGDQLFDTAFFSFGFSPVDVQDTTFGISVYVTGGPAAHDRVFSVVADPSSSARAGEEYVLPDSCIFHAGHVKDTLYVKLLRAAVLQDSTFHLILNLKTNQNFQPNLPLMYDFFSDTLSAISFRLAINDILTAGPYWTGLIQPYFGIFSVKKVRLMNQVVGMPLDFWTSNVLHDFFLGPECIYYATKFGKYLNAQAAAGNKIYEDDGSPMSMAPAYQQ
jgi:hypothetical protein